MEKIIYNLKTVYFNIVIELDTLVASIIFNWAELDLNQRKLC